MASISFQSFELDGLFNFSRSYASTAYTTATSELFCACALFCYAIFFLHIFVSEHGVKIREGCVCVCYLYEKIQMITCGAGQTLALFISQLV